MQWTNTQETGERRRLERVSRIATAMMTTWLCCLSASRGEAPGVALPSDEPVAFAMHGRRLARHVLNRLAFGPAPGQVDSLAKSDWKQWFEQQLNPASIDDQDLEGRLAEECPSLTLTCGQAHDRYQPADTQPPADAAERRRRQQRRNQLRAQIEVELRRAVLLTCGPT